VAARTSREHGESADSVARSIACRADAFGEGGEIGYPDSRAVGPAIY
jgi:hypothetical protein